ncbi:MAG: hypothetical protein RIS09_216 [Actinomycetota bacterium]|jgi:hypothetical protein
MLTIYSSGLIAIGLSFVRKRVWQIITYVFAGISILTGLWLGIVLRDGNGIYVGGIPILLGVAAIWNTTHRNASSGGLPPAPPNRDFS